ncbi:hypothetical protein [Ascidiimonas aurantiaca]|uniref:hypothetical protein n=1 Tax=Ascidiimonas aurantiaca TaxID=1685432 RepID=UPI0030ED4CB3
MKWIIRILFLGILSAIIAGYILKNLGNHLAGDRTIGIAVLVSAFVLMPVFIYHRAKGRKLKDYMLTKENLNKMNKKNGERPENQ